MSRDISSSLQVNLSDDVVYPFFAVELLFDNDETLRLWTGQGSLSYQGNTWVGTGELLNIDAVEETTEMSAKGATITLSGVPSDVISLALSEPYQGRKCNIYFGMFSYGTLLTQSNVFILQQDGSKIYLNESKTSLTEVFTGYMDQMIIDEGAEASSITLTVENKLIILERPSATRFTAEYQKFKYPNDKGLDFIEDMQTKEIVWGREVKK